MPNTRKENPRKQFWSPAEERVLLTLYRTHTLQQIADRLGRGRGSVQWALIRLEKAGRLDRRLLKHARTSWDARSLKSALAEVGHARPEEVHRQVGRGHHAIEDAMRRCGVRVRDLGAFVNTYSLSEVARMFNRPDSTIRRWVNRQILNGSRRPGLRGELRQRWLFRLGDLIDFCRAYPEVIAGVPIPPTLQGQPNPVLPYLRSAPEVRDLTPKQVASQLGLTTKTITYHLRQGHFPGAYRPRVGCADLHPRLWLIPRRSVERFLLNRGKSGGSDTIEWGKSPIGEQADGELHAGDRPPRHRRGD